MRYYVIADVHGFYSLLRRTLEEKGFFTDEEPRKLILLGDLFDRGGEAKEMQDFVLELMERDEVILVRGNHEDCITELADNFLSYLYGGDLRHTHHYVNGTIDTAEQLTGFDLSSMRASPYAFVSALKDTPYFSTIIPATVDYFETENYVFIHGWIPCVRKGTYARYRYEPVDNWREADKDLWEAARWYNGMDAVRYVTADKTVVCGHRTASYGHCMYERKGSEFGEDADFSPYYADGIIAIDACTAVSGKMNCIVIEDEPLLRLP